MPGGGTVETVTTDTFVILDVENAEGLSGSYGFEGPFPFVEGVSTSYPYVNVERVTFEMGIVFPDSVLQASNSTTAECSYIAPYDSENANALIAGMQVLPNVVYGGGYCGYGFVPDMSSSGEYLLDTLVSLVTNTTTMNILTLGCGTDKEQDLTLAFEPTGSGHQVTIITPSGNTSSDYIFYALNRIFLELIDDDEPTVWFSEKCGGYFTKMKITVKTNKEYEISGN